MGLLVGVCVSHRDLESVFSKNISVGTRMMVNCAREGQGQGKLWWRLKPILTRRPRFVLGWQLLSVVPVLRKSAQAFVLGVGCWLLCVVV